MQVAPSPREAITYSLGVNAPQFKAQQRDSVQRGTTNAGPRSLIHKRRGRGSLTHKRRGRGRERGEEAERGRK